MFTEHVSELADRLGPILVELHPSFGSDQLSKLEAFLSRLPADFRYAVEFRRRSWAEAPDAVRLLRSLNIGLAATHRPWYVRLREVTADFTYLRLLGRQNAFPEYGHV